VAAWIQSEVCSGSATYAFSYRGFVGRPRLAGFGEGWLRGGRSINVLCVTSSCRQNELSAGEESNVSWLASGMWRHAIPREW
jgi:hypothetical protein